MRTLQHGEVGAVLEARLIKDGGAFYFYISTYEGMQSIFLDFKNDAYRELTMCEWLS